MESKIIDDRAAGYFNAFEQIRKRVVDDKLATILLQEIAKDMRMDRMEKNGNGNGKDKPASDKQINYLKRLGVKVDKPLTRRGASLLIDEQNGVKPE